MEKRRKPAPCFFHFDFETHTFNNDTVIKPWTLIYVSSNEKTNYVKHKGHDCCRKFIGDLNRLTKTADGKDRDVIAFAHNGQGFDLTFIQRALYKYKVEISNQLMNGAKTLSVTYRYEDSQVQFKDSMCFLRMFLDTAGKAFKLQAAKGFFPHALQTRDSLYHTGQFPSQDKFNPHHMKKDRRDEFLEWHAKEKKKDLKNKGWCMVCRKNEIFTAKLMSKSCKAVVSSFQNGFKNVVDSILWEKMWQLRQPVIESSNSIMFKPTRLQWNPSTVGAVTMWTKAIEWLAFQEKKGVAGKLKHLRNGGEQKVLLPTGWKFVDGYNPETKTVYEFLDVSIMAALIA